MGFYKINAEGKKSLKTSQYLFWESWPMKVFGFNFPERDVSALGSASTVSLFRTPEDARGKPALRRLELGVTCVQ